MALSNSDWAELTHHIRQELRTLGYAELDERLMIDSQASPNARVDFLDYLSRLTSALKERSSSSYGKILSIFQSSLEIDGTQSVNGVEVVFTDDDAVRYKTNRFLLQDGDNFEPLIFELIGLKNYLKTNGLLNEQE